MRVQTYLTLLSTLALSSTMKMASPQLEAKVRHAWQTLSAKERQHATSLIETSPTRTALGREHLRLVAV